jgi:Tol biopolymer transport system component
VLIPVDEPTFDSRVSPSWSPDGTRILFARAGETQMPGLFVVPAAGGAATELHISGYSPSWGPTRIAWIDFGTNPTSLWTAKPDGTDRREVADGDIRSPAWSHDGRLAYLDGFTAAVIVDGASTHRVPLPFADVTSLGWSPDGTRFVVAARGAGTAVPDIYTLRTDGTEVRRLTTDLVAGSPSWG